MKANKTYIQLFFFSRVAGAYVEANKDGNKITESIQNFAKKKLKGHVEHY